MVDLARLPVPIVQAPMAGGASRPELVRAVNDAGGLGFLAGGYVTADALREQVRATAAVTDRPFGVNLFVPEPPDPAADVAGYRHALQPLAERFDVALPEPDWADTDYFAAKVDVLLDERVPVVSFAFGVPPADVLDALRQRGTTVVVTVTTAAEAQAAAGADALCVQGSDAGAHRSTHRVADEPGSTPLTDLLAEIRPGVPVIAAGGLTTGEDIARALAAGAAAVQLGTAYLRSDESGAKQPHKDALVDPDYQTTVVTRAFTGRPARGLRNLFIDTFGEHAPPAYPQVHHLTAPIRAAAARAGDPQHLALWAGTGHRQARTGPAGEITERLWSDAQRARG